MKAISLLGLIIITSGCRDASTVFNGKSIQAEGLITKEAPADEVPLSRESERFIIDNYSNSRLMIDLAGLARNKSTKQYVKDFAQEQIAAYTSLQQSLQQLAADKSVELPVSMLRFHMDIKMELMTKLGSEYEHDYLRWTIEDTRENMKQFENIPHLVSNPAVIDFAKKNQALLQHRLDAATALYHEL